ncbi:MAG: ATP-binding cassette domain-containing protein [Spirochaetaceae bacterium]|nr:ATP-binding cassette domain-containing protein [Spirochaetaceae bacterium]
MLSEIQHVAKIADIHDNIIGFENSYKTVLGERGVTLSGGQKQRVSIARAIFKKPSILVLDDSFSAVDTETEKNILSNLKQLNKDIGFLIISHRISTIKDCDEILVLDEGRIIERGTDETLMQQQGKYYEIALQQRLEDEIKEKLS